MSSAPLEYELDVREDPAHYFPFDLNQVGAIGTGFSSIVYGWAIKNMSSSGTAALDIYDASTASGIPVFPITLAANESDREWFGGKGILFPNALYVNVTAGEVKGAIFYRHFRRG